MGMFAVKNDKGEWLSFDSSHESVWDTNNPTFFNDKSYAEAQNTGLDGSHVVELVEPPAKIVVSEEEAEMLELAKDDYCAAAVISAYSTEHIGAMGQDRLMRAYVNGYTVAKEKKYLLPMDGTLEENDGYNNYQLYAYCYKGRWLTDEIETDPAYKHFTVTQNELETAPAWVKAIKPVEVTDDEQ